MWMVSNGGWKSNTISSSAYTACVAIVATAKQKIISNLPFSPVCSLWTCQSCIYKGKEMESYSDLRSGHGKQFKPPRRNRMNLINLSKPRNRTILTNTLCCTRKIIHNKLLIILPEVFLSFCIGNIQRSKNVYSSLICFDHS